MERGFAVITVIFIIVGFAVMGSSAVAILSGSGAMLADEFRSQQAFHVADAGLSYTAQQLVADSDWSDNTSFTKSFGPGSFAITYVTQTTSTATVRSAGTVGGITRTIQASFGGGGTSAFQHALYTTGTISNNGGTGTINGDSAAVGSIATGTMTFNGAIDANDPSVSVPTPNWTYWLSVATTVVSGNYQFNTGTYSGIYYITGNVTFHGNNITVNGTIVTRGKFTINGQSNVVITATVPNPAVVANNTVKFNGGSGNVITGYVVTTADVKFTGNADLDITGGVVAGTGGIDFGPSDSLVTYNAAYAPSLGFTGGASGGVSVSNWREYH